MEQDNEAITIDANDLESGVEEQLTTTPESSTEETKDVEVAKDSEDLPDNDGFDDDDDDDEPEEESQDEPEEESEPEPEPESKPQAKNKAENRIRSLANENRALKEEVQKLVSGQYQPRTAQDLIDEEGMDENEARLEAMEQQMTVERLNSQVVQINSDVNMESQQVLHDFPIFDSQSDQYDPEFASEVATLYEEAAELQMDKETGLVVNAKVLPYDFYKRLHNIRGSGQKTGETKGQQAAQRNLAASEPKGSTPPAKPAKSAFEQGFDSIS